MLSLTCSLLIPIFSNYPCRGLLTEHEVLGIEETLSILISIPYWDRIGEVTCGGSPHLSCKRDQIDMRDCLDRWVTSPTWGPPPPCKQALRSKEAKWQRLPRRWSCYIGSEKRGFLNPHFHSLFTRNPASDFFHQYPEYHLSFSFLIHTQVLANSATPG